MKKKFAAALLALAMLVGLMVAPASAAAFDDVPEDHWAASAIERWNGYGVLNGHADGTFAPDTVMTRAQFAQMLVNMLGLTAKGEVEFTDVNEGDWYAEVIQIAVAAGIMNGFTDGSARPNAPITFEQAAVMLCRALGLAETTGGADWSKESIDKLTSLGMIGEGADEHLQVGVDCDRAVVAALADVVVAEYVNEDREEPISGEVKGVVVVVKNAKVEIKDATVAAPIVVESASVTLTNTQAENVVVSGTEASITADKDSSVTDVAVSGSAPAVAIDGEVKGDVTIAAETAKVELNGEVSGNVTVEEGSTAVEIKGDGVDADKVVNNSTEDVKVNDETVEGKPAEETTDPDNNKKPSTGTGDEEEGEDKNPKPAGNHVHKWEKVPAASTAAQAEGDGDTPAATPTPSKASTCTEQGFDSYVCTAKLDDGSDCTATKQEMLPWLITSGKPRLRAILQRPPVRFARIAKPDASHTHSSLTETDKTTVVTVAATCTTDGTQEIRCKACGKVLSTETIEATGHTEVVIRETKATCVTTGLTAGKRCSVCGVVYEAQKVTNVDTENGHKLKEVEAKEATCTEAGVAAHKVCELCNKTFVAGENGAVVAGTPEAIPAKGHFGEDGKSKENTAQVDATCVKDGVKAGTKCTVCGKFVEGGEKIPKLAHSYTGAVVEAKAATCTEKGNTAGKKCVNGCDGDNTEEIAALGHSWKNGTCETCKGTHSGDDHKDENSDGKCDVCEGEITSSGTGTGGTGTPGGTPETPAA